MYTNTHTRLHTDVYKHTRIQSQKKDSHVIFLVSLISLRRHFGQPQKYSAHKQTSIHTNTHTHTQTHTNTNTQTTNQPVFSNSSV